jgi:uncharacterized protein
MNEDIIEQVKNFVDEESKKTYNIWGYDFFTLHIVEMHNYAKFLAEKLNADVEIVELAAWLHDIGAITYGRKDHHITGAKIAEEKLKELNYPEEKIERIRKCVLNHRGSQKMEKESVEEKIIADADALSAFDHIQGLFFAAYVAERRSQKEARDSVKNKLVNSWNKLCFSESKDLAKPKYEAAMLLLS